MGSADNATSYKWGGATKQHDNSSKTINFQYCTTIPYTYTGHGVCLDRAHNGDNQLYCGDRNFST